MIYVWLPSTGVPLHLCAREMFELAVARVMPHNRPSRSLACGGERGCSSCSGEMAGEACETQLGLLVQLEGLGGLAGLRWASWVVLLELQGCGLTWASPAPRVSRPLRIGASQASPLVVMAVMPKTAAETLLSLLLASHLSSSILKGWEETTWYLAERMRSGRREEPRGSYGK